MFCYKLFRYKLWQRNCTKVGESWPVAFRIQPIFISLASISSSLLCTYHPPSPWGTPGKYSFVWGLIGGFERTFYPRGGGSLPHPCPKNWELCRKKLDRFQVVWNQGYIQKISGLPLSSWWGDSQCGRPHNLRYCWFVHYVMTAMLVVKNKCISLPWELNSIFI